MLRGIARIVTHRWAGLAWCLVAVAFAGAFAQSRLQARQNEDFLRGRIAALAAHDASQLEAQLVSCRATVRSYSASASADAPRAAVRPGETTQVKALRGDPRAVAAELARTPPAGFDVCARMESADRAVLSALDRR
jgi:hypothetical protein